ncbi:TPA: hypothetical protein ACH3X2_008104 [Trebouxia sp. C0005]
MTSQYHKHSMSTTSKVGMKSIRSRNSRVPHLFPPFSWRCVHWQCSGPLNLMKSLFRIKPRSSTPDSAVSQRPKVKQLSQCESFEKVATGCYMPISTACAPAEGWMNQHSVVQPQTAPALLGESTCSSLRLWYLT